MKTLVLVLTLFFVVNPSFGNSSSKGSEQCVAGRCISVAKIGPLANSEIDPVECDPAQPDSAFDSVTGSGGDGEEAGVVY